MATITLVSIFIWWANYWRFKGENVPTVESLVTLPYPSFLSYQPRKDLGKKKTKLAFVQVLIDDDSDEVLKTSNWT